MEKLIRIIIASDECLINIIDGWYNIVIQALLYDSAIIRSSANYTETLAAEHRRETTTKG